MDVATGRKLGYTLSYKQELRAKVLEQHKTHGISAAASLDHTPGSTSNQWQERELRDYLAATWCEGKRLDGVATLQLDGTRLGQPAKETISYIMRSARRDRAWLLPPQAFVAGYPIHL